MESTEAKRETSLARQLSEQQRGSTMAIASPHLLDSDWVTEICRLFAQGKTSTLRLAHTVYSGKAKLRRGEWEQLWRSGTMPFSKTKGKMLVKIGQTFGGPNLANGQMFDHLPGEWSILHQLARLDLPTIKELIERQSIHPDLTFNQAKELVSSILGSPSARSPRLRARVQQRLRNLRDSLHRTCARWRSADKCWLARELRKLSEEFAVAATVAGPERSIAQPPLATNSAGPIARTPCV
jgi:hypothetical protein